MTDKKALWNDAGKSGLILGGICLAYMACNFLLSTDSGPAALFAGLAGLILWAAKFVACIYLFKHFMKAFATANPEVDNSDTFKYGCAVAFLSALIYSAGYMAYVMFINPDVFSESLDILASNPMMTSESMDMVEQMIPKMPTMTFFANLFYCWMFGTVLSAIFSRNIPSTNPFANNKTDEQ